MAFFDARNDGWKSSAHQQSPRDVSNRKSNKIPPNGRQRRFNFIFSFSMHRLRRCVLRTVDRVYIVWPSTEWSLDQPLFGDKCEERMFWDANWNLFRKKQYHVMLVFGCPHRTTHLKCQKFKLIYDSPANLSLTAWWASAAWCNGGIAHASGVLCGGTRNTWPGLYSGYDEYNALAVEYGMPALAKCVANFACSASNSNEWVSRSDAGLLLLFSNGLDSRRDMLNGRFSLDERVCSDCIESLNGREKKQIKMHFYGIVFANWLSYALNGPIGGETTG